MGHARTLKNFDTQLTNKRWTLAHGRETAFQRLRQRYKNNIQGELSIESASAARAACRCRQGLRASRLSHGSPRHWPANTIATQGRVGRPPTDSSPHLPPPEFGPCPLSWTANTIMAAHTADWHAAHPPADMRSAHVREFLDMSDRIPHVLALGAATQSLEKSGSGNGIIECAKVGVGE